MDYKDGILVIGGQHVTVTPANVREMIGGHDAATIRSDTETARRNCASDHLGRVKRDQMSDGLMILRIHLESNAA